MYDPYTGRAHKAGKRASVYARCFGDSSLGTEHLLLGIIDIEDGNGFKILNNLGINISDIRELLEKRPLTKSAHAKGSSVPKDKYLENALMYAREISDEHAGTEHLLLGILHQKDSLGGETLIKVGVTVEAAENALKKLNSRKVKS